MYIHIDQVKLHACISLDPLALFLQGENRLAQLFVNKLSCIKLLHCKVHLNCDIHNLHY